MGLLKLKVVQVTWKYYDSLSLSLSLAVILKIELLDNLPGIKCMHGSILSQTTMMMSFFMM